MLDGRQIGSGSRGPVTAQLQSMYFDAVRGKRPQNADWLTPVA
jgi:branched-chain amino acid aminotransferase